MDQGKTRVADALAPGEARFFDGWVRGELRPCFAVGLPQGGAAAFVNVCAHRNRPVLVAEGPEAVESHGAGALPVVECTAHGAIYDAATGECVEGPCVGAQLIPVPLEIRDDGVFAVDDDAVDDSIYAIE